MTFLQPWMLWGLAAAAAPILIHLLNRLRYRTVRWGAMYFLRRVTRSSMRRSRLRHYLILACRTLALALLALAMMRPMIGGRIGAGLAGAPDAILVLLDRSASMERMDPRLGLSLRAHGLSLVAGVPPETVRGSRVVLIESARPEPLELASLAELPALSRAGPSDTAADAPALFESAHHWLARNRPGRAELWVVSDGQASNWRPGAAAWPSLAARLAALEPRVRVQLLLLQGDAGGNLAVQAREIRRLPIPGGETEFLLALYHPAPDGTPVPANRVLGGERTLLPLRADAFESEHSLRLPPPGDGPGWGWVELPADGNLRDNTAYFVYGRGPEGRVVARIEDERVGFLARAAFPAGPGAPPVVEPWPETGAPDLSDAGLVVWQGEGPEGEAAAILGEFVRSGGTLLALPPAEDAESGGPFGTWAPVEEAEPGRPFRVARWDPFSGPFSNAADGRALPLAEAAVTRRRRPVPPPGGEGEGFETAVFQDGEPLLLRRTEGAGRVYSWGTLPLPGWSDLHDGRLWVPALWRMREEGARRLSDIRMERCGDPLPGGPEAVWEPVGADNGRDPRVHAGIYRHGDLWVARNRPPEEDLPGVLEPAQIAGLLPGVPVDAPGVPADRTRLYSEASFPFLLLAGLFLLAEALLALGDFRRPSAASLPAGLREKAR